MSTSFLILICVILLVELRSITVLNILHQQGKQFFGVYFVEYYGVKKKQKSDPSGLISLSCLLIDPNGGRWSGFSLQQALSSTLMFSSHRCSHSAGRRGSPWKGARNCMMISEENVKREIWARDVFKQCELQECGVGKVCQANLWAPGWNLDMGST